MRSVAPAAAAPSSPAGMRTRAATMPVSGGVTTATARRRSSALKPLPVCSAACLRCPPLRRPPIRQRRDLSRTLLDQPLALAQLGPG